MTQFYVKCQTGQDSFQIENGHMLKASLTQPAENNRANTELLNRLEEILGKRPHIVSGHRSRRKKLQVDLPEEEIAQRIEDANG